MLPIVILLVPSSPLALLPAVARLLAAALVVVR